jgi:hypothetical protein
MAQAFISTGQPNLRRMTVNNVAASYTNPVPTSTKPATGVVMDMALSQGYAQPSLLKALPWGALDNGTAWSTSSTTTGMRIVGWQSYRNVAASATWWFPTILAQYTLLFPSTNNGYNVDGTADVFVFGGFGAAITTPQFPTPNTFSSNGTSTSSGSITTSSSVLVDLAGSQLVTADFIAPAPTAPRTVNMGLFWYAI